MLLAGKAAPKAKAQIAKPKASSGSRNTGVAGRPSECPSVRARVMFQEFSNIPDDSSDSSYKKYFGDEYDKKIRYMSDALKKMDATMASCFLRACLHLLNCAMRRGILRFWFHVSCCACA